MTDDPLLAALYERFAPSELEALAREARIREAREHHQHYRTGDPARFIPGQIDKQRKKKSCPTRTSPQQSTALSTSTSCPPEP